MLRINEDHVARRVATTVGRVSKLLNVHYRGLTHTVLLIHATAFPGESIRRSSLLASLYVALSLASYITYDEFSKATSLSTVTLRYNIRRIMRRTKIRVYV
jgi:hypothetical protein